MPGKTAEVMALSCTRAGRERGSQLGARRWLAKVKVETAEGWLLISARSWSCTERHSTRTAEIEGVRNSSAEAPVTQIGRRQGASKQKAASQGVSKRTAFVLNASPPARAPLSDPAPNPWRVQRRNRPRS